MSNHTTVAGAPGGAVTPDIAPVVTLRRVRRTYGTNDAAVVALDDVTVDFRRGSFTAVMGPSGSGKSTLLQCAAGLDRPTSGRVTVAGHALDELDDHQLTLLRRNTIGFVFQSYNLLPALTAEHNVALPLRLAGRRPSRDEVFAALAAVGVADRAGNRPSELSGGQQQRVAIARALITKPAVLFADEPTGALDSVSSRDVMTLLRRLVDDDHQTIIMVTHDPVVASFADVVVFVTDGRIVGELPRPTAASVTARMAQLEPQRRRP